jgi:trk system potassium uptake protein TrkH
VATLRTLDQQIAPLSYAVRLRVVLKYAGQLSIILAGLTVVPAAVALVGGSVDTALRYLLVTVLLATFGVATARLPRPRACCHTKRWSRWRSASWSRRC